MCQLGPAQAAAGSWCTVASPAELGFSSVRFPTVSPSKPSLSSSLESRSVRLGLSCLHASLWEPGTSILSLTLCIGVSQTCLVPLFKKNLWVFVYLFYFIFSLPFSPLIPFSLSAITTLLSVFMSLFSFYSVPLPLNHPPQSSLLLSTSLCLFCLLVQFVHKIPHMSEIIWYLSFSDWLISLSIMFSRSIHAVNKG